MAAASQPVFGLAASAAAPLEARVPALATGLPRRRAKKMVAALLQLLRAFLRWSRSSSLGLYALREAFSLLTKEP